jgi:hypothetical protein
LRPRRPWRPRAGLYHSMQRSALQTPARSPLRGEYEATRQSSAFSQVHAGFHPCASPRLSMLRIMHSVVLAPPKPSKYGKIPSAQ